MLTSHTLFHLDFKHFYSIAHSVLHAFSMFHCQPSFTSLYNDLCGEMALIEQRQRNINKAHSIN